MGTCFRFVETSEQLKRTVRPRNSLQVPAGSENRCECQISLSGRFRFTTS